MKKICIPFADDFNLITKNKLQHQKLQDDIQEKITSMGLTLKPKKCRAMSISSGHPVTASFTLRDHSDINNPTKIVLKDMTHDPHKFLGLTLTFDNTAKDHLDVLTDILVKKLENLDSSLVRGEYKLSVYERYLLPSIRYHLSIHTIHQTHLEKLDMIAQKYLKKWLGVPTRACTNLSVFHPYLLSIKPVSQVYLQGHVGNYINSTMKADTDVKIAIESSIFHESQWTRKSSTVVKCKDIMEKLSETEHVPTMDNCPNVACSPLAEVPKLKKAASAVIAETYLDYWNEVAKDLIMQGNFLRLGSHTNIAFRKVSLVGLPEWPPTLWPHQTIFSDGGREWTMPVNCARVPSAHYSTF